MIQSKKKSLQVLADRPSGELVTSGELADLRFMDRKGRTAAPSLIANKMFLTLLNHAGPKITKQGERFQINLADINWSHLEASQVEEIAAELAGTVICVDMELRGKPVKRYGAFLSDIIRYDEGSNILEYEFSPLIRTIFQVSKHWASLSARAVYAFESAYALRLYEMICLRQGLKYKSSETYTIEELRRKLGVPHGKMSRFPDFRRYALERAIQEVNYLSGVYIDYTTKRRGRRIQEITLIWRVKEEEELEKTNETLNQHRSTRQQNFKSKTEELEKSYIDKRRKLAEDMAALSQGSLLPDDEIPY